jgi:transposase
MLIIIEHTGVYHLKLANYLYENDYQVAVVRFMKAKISKVKVDKDAEKEIEVKLKILEDLQQQFTMLRNRMENRTN